MLKRTLIVMLTLVVTISLCGTAFAADNRVDSSRGNMSIMFTYISSIYTDLTISSSGVASCTATITAYSGIDSVKISGYLQYYNNGWITLKSWSQTTSGTYGSMAKTYSVSEGYNYRFLVYYYVYDGSNVVESTSGSDTYNFS